jgi:hypothetical protein
MRILFLSLLFLLMPVVNQAVDAPTVLAGVENPDVYTSVNLSDTGLPKEIFDLAVKGLAKLTSEGKLNNPDILTIADYSQSSKNKRLYVIDLKNRKLLYNTYVAHGRNTGEEFAKYFSNQEGSLKSSLGFYVTENPIVGPHTGYSLLIRGVEKGFNDNACKREIIIHAADYATEGFIRKYGRLGRSFGCPAIPPDLARPIISTIRGGTCLFIYNPDPKYLCASALLN